MILTIILWLTFATSISTALLRAYNCSYKKELYFISGVSQIPLIYNQMIYGSFPLVLLEISYLFISILGYYKHKENCHNQI